MKKKIKNVIGLGIGLSLGSTIAQGLGQGQIAGAFNSPMFGTVVTASMASEALKYTQPKRKHK